jgi:hypothetical protein
MLNCFFFSLFLITVLTFSSSAALASGSGHRSHENNQIDTHDKGDVITYKDSSGGIDAYLELNVPFKKKTSKGFVAKCDIRVFLEKVETGEYIKATKLALRSTIGHGEFGEAKALMPVGKDRMGTDIVLKEQGKHHFLILADIPSIGSRKFHFHHTFK